MTKRNRIYLLCGFMGSGKSYFLDKAKSWNVGTFDLDEQVFQKEAKTFSTLGDFIRAKGWESFRDTEAKVFRELVTSESEEDLILALGGGTLDSQATRELISSQDNMITVWLDVSFQECLERIKGDHNRPQLDKSDEELEALYKSRLKFFKKANLQMSSNDVNALRTLSDLERKLD